MRNIVRTDWKVSTPARGFVAAFKDVSDAAVMVAFYGTGAQIRYKHHTLVWTEGKEDQPAGADYDHVAHVCTDRVNAIIRAGREQSARDNAAVVAARKELTAQNQARDALRLKQNPRATGPYLDTEASSRPTEERRANDLAEAKGTKPE